MTAQTELTEETLIFDMMSPKGHVRLNRFYLTNTFSTKVRFYVSYDLIEEYRDFDVYPLGEKPCGSSLIERLALAFCVLRIIRRQKVKNVVFLSYDLATLPLVSNVLQQMAVNVTCFEHNTAPNSRLRGLFHKFSARTLKRLVYTPYLRDLYQSLGLEAEYVPHPCLPCEIRQGGSHEWTSIVSELSRRYAKIGFCPSGSVTVAQMEEIAGLYPDVLFVMKSKETSRLPNLLSVPYFEYYGNALEQCDFAVIPFSSDYKVSGPVFEALAMGKPVLVLKNKFGRYVKSLFSRPIFFAGEQIPTDTTAVNFTQFNHEIIRLCGKYLSQYAGGQETPVHHTTV